MINVAHGSPVGYAVVHKCRLEGRRYNGELLDDHNLVRERKWHPQAPSRVSRNVADGRIFRGHGIDSKFQRGGVDSHQLVRLIRALLVPNFAGGIHRDAVRFRFAAGGTVPQPEFLVTDREAAQASAAEVGEVNCAAYRHETPWFDVRFRRSKFGDLARFGIYSAEFPSGQFAKP